MFRRRLGFRSVVGALALSAAALQPVWAQPMPGGSTVAPRPADIPEQRPEVIMARALRSNPLTAPYAIGAYWRDGKVILSGRVGTKQVHDSAVQMAIAFGLPFRDDLVIDTAETMRVAMSATPSMTGYGALAPNVSSSYYVYPEPLFGWLDDPFFGMQPPVVSFAPWWRGRRDPEMRPAGMGGLGPPNVAGPNGRPFAQAPAGSTPSTGVPPQAGGGPGPMELPPARGDLDITVDANGQVFLRGVVASEEVAREIVQTAWSVPGVSRVYTQLQVKPRPAGVANDPGPPPSPQPVAAVPDREATPPNPTPETVREIQPAAAVPAQPPAAQPPRPHASALAALDGGRITRRVIEALRRRPKLADQPIQVRTSGDSILLSGKVPSAYEAMLAFRTAQQTPGVRDVVDRLEFSVPDEDHPNPLVSKGRPEDLEPYLTAQMSRHLGELAHIDGVKVRGNHLEIRGTLLEKSDRARALAILRSIPVLHGFELDATLTAD